MEKDARACICQEAGLCSLYSSIGIDDDEDFNDDILSVLCLLSLHFVFSFSMMLSMFPSCLHIMCFVLKRDSTITFP